MLKFQALQSVVIGLSVDPAVPGFDSKLQIALTSIEL